MILSIYEHRSELPVSVDKAFAWHERTGAFERLAPPWRVPKVLERSGLIADGSEVTVAVPLGPFRTRWTVRHFDYEINRRFRDRQVRGPFAKWVHTHGFEAIDDRRCRITDHIEYAVPLGGVGRVLGGRMIRRMLQRDTAYRHRTIADDLALHGRFADRPRLTVAITGASGLIGQGLSALLSTGGHRVIRLVRHPPTAADESQWDPACGLIDAGAMAPVDAVVHLAGENIATGRWTQRKMRAIRESRVDATRALVASFDRLPRRPRVMITASAMGYYASDSRKPLDETGGPGTGFLAEVSREWEKAAMSAADAGVRVVPMRIGLVLTPRGGALQKMLPPAQMGLGGMLGRGDRYMSWISHDDTIGGIYHALMDDRLSGPVNLVGPMPATANEFIATLGRVLGRPVLGWMPKTLGRAALGGMAHEVLEASYRIHPGRLLGADYGFRHANLEACLRHVLGRVGPDGG